MRGKHKPTFTPHIDTGDHVVIVNADKVVLTGAKVTDKNVYDHSGYPGGLRSRAYGTFLAEKPEEAEGSGGDGEGDEDDDGNEIYGSDIKKIKEQRIKELAQLLNQKK